MKASTTSSRPVSAVKPSASTGRPSTARGQAETMRWISGTGFPADPREGLLATGAANGSRHVADRARSAHRCRAVRS